MAYCFSWSCAVRSLWWQRDHLPLVWGFHFTYWTRFYFSKESCNSVQPENYHHLVIAFFFFFYTEVWVIYLFLYTPCPWPSQSSRENMSFCLKMLPRKHRSPWPRVISVFVLCYPDQNILLLPQCRMCLQKQHATAWKIPTFPLEH